MFDGVLKLFNFSAFHTQLCHTLHMFHLTGNGMVLGFAVFVLLLVYFHLSLHHERNSAMALCNISLICVFESLLSLGFLIPILQLLLLIVGKYLLFAEVASTCSSLIFLRCNLSCCFLFRCYCIGGSDVKLHVVCCC